MHQHRTIRFDQQEPGGEREMGLEAANVINRTTGYDESHPPHITVCNGMAGAEWKYAPLQPSPSQRVQHTLRQLRWKVD
ncbi:hypothetical protein StoSoilB22_26130 [Arthrobacter sp. StoSoilB22]|nr:hypothetical protein StoSoilB22_26130 [Arthrobacter sp. StoSoilB22]